MSGNGCVYQELSGNWNAAEHTVRQNKTQGRHQESWF